MPYLVGSLSLSLSLVNVILICHDWLAGLHRVLIMSEIVA
jgi:hypothetical protein